MAELDIEGENQNTCPHCRAVDTCVPVEEINEAQRTGKLPPHPSTADANVDDPTIRRCKRFAQDFGYTGLIVVNLYAFRATNPKALSFAADPIGPDNDTHIKALCAHRDVICSWGANAGIDRVSAVVQLLKSVNSSMYHLGLTKGGMPKHPLYISASQPIIKWGE
ncbi:MAG: DUF1643 domain-containing protein [Gammaproteobacteria bacterium]|nr:DUF1643 domain-containing protein [Gammaproteobacteria bacterium]